MADKNVFQKRPQLSFPSTSVIIVQCSEFSEEKFQFCQCAIDMSSDFMHERTKKNKFFMHAILINFR